MDFSALFQLRTKKYWWMDVIFYFAVSLLIATVLCYAIFLLKNKSQAAEIEAVSEKLKTVGTFQQKEYDNEVIAYQKKIQDFSLLFKNHEFASNIFAFLQDQTMPSIWYSHFSLDSKNRTVQVTGEAASMDALSRQIRSLENNEYIKGIYGLNSSLGDSAKIAFSMNLTLNPNIFAYLTKLTTLLRQAENTTRAATSSAQAPFKSGEKRITAFHLLLSPEVVGKVDQENYRISLKVPFGTDVKHLIPAIVLSTGATVSPASNAIQDFSSPVSYTVTAEDGSVQKYNVSVAIMPAPAPVKEEKKASPLIIVSGIFGVLAAISAGGFLAFRKMGRKKVDFSNLEKI